MPGSRLHPGAPSMPVSLRSFGLVIQYGVAGPDQVYAVRGGAGQRVASGGD